MRKLILLIASISIIFGSEIPKSHIIDTNWLEKNLVIIDTRKDEDFLKSHIQGAINIPKKEWFKGEVNGIKKYYNTPEQTQELLQNAGIKEESYSTGLNETDFADSASTL